MWATNGDRTSSGTLLRTFSSCFSKARSISALSFERKLKNRRQPNLAQRSTWGAVLWMKSCSGDAGAPPVRFSCGASISPCRCSPLCAIAPELLALCSSSGVVRSGSVVGREVECSPNAGTGGGAVCLGELGETAEGASSIGSISAVVRRSGRSVVSS